MKGTKSVGRIVKRVLDLGVSTIGLVLLLLPFCAIALAIKLDDGGAVFFRQERVGKSGRLFLIWKLRSMIPNAEMVGAKHGFVKDDPRITRMGRLLRSTSLDELPQLLNVVKGEMSLVGPRPTLPHQVARYSNRQMQRLSVKPGITGLALVRGRNAIPWSERIEIDLEYIEEWSFWLDVKIMARTLMVVFFRDGLRADQLAEEVEDFDSGNT